MANTALCARIRLRRGARIAGLLTMLFLPSCAPYLPQSYPAPNSSPPPASAPAAAPLLRVSPAGVEFGPTEAGGARIAEIAVRNEGGAPGWVEGVDVQGEAFRLAGEECSGARLRPGATCSVAVRFQPDRGGRHRGELVLRLRDSDRRRVEVPLSGEARRPGGGRAPDIRVSPSALDLGLLDEDERRTMEVEVANAGGGELKLQDAWIEGRGFSLLEDGCSGRLLAPGRTCRVRVGFAAHDRGEYRGRLLLASSDRDERRVEVPLGADVRRRQRPPDARAEPARLDFGTREAGGSHTLDVQLRNAGGGELRVRAVTVEGRGFRRASDTCSGAALPPDRSCTVGVRFDPEGKASYAGRLLVESNDPDKAPLAVPLSGEGLPAPAPSIAVSPGRLDFGRLDAGEARLLQVEASNRGRADLRIDAVEVEGPGFELAADRCSRRSLPPGKTCTVGVRFAPAGGNAEGVLRFASNDPERARMLLPLKGTGRAAPAQPACRERRLSPIAQGRGGWAGMAVLDVLEERQDEDCSVYVVPVNKGSLFLCVPEGYRLREEGFEAAARGECKGDGGRYERWEWTGPTPGGAVRATVERLQNGRPGRTVVFDLRPKKGEKGKDREERR